MKVNGWEVPRWLKIASVSAPLVVLLFTGAFAAHNAYLTIQDSKAKIDTLTIKHWELKIDSVVTQHEQDTLLQHILRRIDPENADRLIKEADEKKKEMIAALKKEMNGNNKKEK